MVFVSWFRRPDLKTAPVTVFRRKLNRVLKKEAEKVFARVWTVPNVLTIFRLLLVPVFIIVFAAGHPKAALAVFVAASLTDLLDGFLARKLNQITDFGKLFDPLADKLMVLTALACQGFSGVLPWAAILIVAAKEIYMVIGGLIMLHHDIVVYSNLLGKSAQVFFIASLILSFFHEELAAWGTRLDLILLWITVALALSAMIVYTVAAVRDYHAKQRGDKLSSYQ